MSVQEPIDWKHVSDLYDRVASSRASRRSSPSKSSSQNDTEHDMCEKLKFAIDQLNGDRMTEVMYNICRLNHQCSAEHIANIFVRSYGRVISPFRVPFKPFDYIPNDVWAVVVCKIAEHKAVAQIWVGNEIEEMWNRHYVEEQP